MPSVGVSSSVRGQGDASARMAAGRTMMAEQGVDGRFKVKDVVEVSVSPLYISLVASKSVHLARRRKKYRCCGLYQGLTVDIFDLEGGGGRGGFHRDWRFVYVL